MTVFNCPIFGVDTNVAACGKLYTLVWRGDRPNVRAGCQACMDSSKCPISNLAAMNRVRQPENQINIEGGKLPKELLERIRPITVMEHHLNNRGVSPGERAAIALANDRIDKMLGSAPSIENQPRRKAKSKTVTVKTAPAPISTNADKAAATGDLGAAISQAA